MSTPSLDDVLQRVAAGELSPQEALALLEPAGSAPTSAPVAAPDQPATNQPGPDGPPAWGTPDPSTPSGSASAQTAGPTPARRVRVNASYRSVDVLADHGVSEVLVTGSHSVRRDGDALVIDTLETPFGDGEPGEERTGRFSFADLPRGLAWARAWKEHHLVVRVNPELPVEVDGVGASVRLSGLEAGANVRLLASAAKLERLRGPLELDVMSSSVKGFAAPTGRSRIGCESSSVKLVLGAGTDVTVQARNRLGKVVLPTSVSKGGLVDPDVLQARFGAGRGELVVDATMSSVTLAPDGDLDRQTRSAGQADQ